MDPTVVGSVTGTEADVMLAAYYAAEVAAKTIKAGNTNTQVGVCLLGLIPECRVPCFVFNFVFCRCFAISGQGCRSRNCVDVGSIVGVKSGYSKRGARDS